MPIRLKLFVNFLLRRAKKPVCLFFMMLQKTFLICTILVSSIACHINLEYGNS